MAIAPGNFLCGCSPERDRPYRTVALANGLLTTQIKDSEGFLVCPQHGSRLYGWRSVPKSANHPGPKFPYLRLTPKEMEDRKLNRTPFPKRVLNTVSTVEDTRDMRDPETLGISILAQANGKGKNAQITTDLD